MNQGIHTIPSAQYHADPAPEPSLSNSLIKILLGKSPAHARLAHPRLNPDYEPYESDRFDLGNAAHALFLEGMDTIVVVHADDWRKKDAQEVRDAARRQGRIPLLKSQYDAALKMVSVAEQFTNQSVFAKVFEFGKPEQTIIWSTDGIWCRGRIDWLADDRSVIVDYKTTSAPSPQDWIRSNMLAYGYDTQQAFYRRGMEALGHRTRFLFLVQEDTAPFACYWVEAGTSMQELAESKVQRAINLWQQCMVTGKWPAHSTAVNVAEAPAWAMSQEFGDGEIEVAYA